MGNRLDISGQRFGRLIATSPLPPKQRKNSRKKDYLWHCVCDCGRKVDIDMSRLRRGVTRSCGCLQRDLMSQKQKSHGCTGTRIYQQWKGMIARCYRHNHVFFHLYGGRGISVCDRWKTSFENFQADMGPCPPKFSLDRINNDGNYEPANCRWATMRQQSRNKSTNRLVTFEGMSFCVQEWAERIGMHPETLRARLRKWPVVRALTEPVKLRRDLA